MFAGGSGGRGSDAGGVGEIDAGVPEAVAELPDQDRKLIFKFFDGFRFDVDRLPQSVHRTKERTPGTNLCQIDFYRNLN